MMIDEEKKSMMFDSKTFDVIVGSETGLLKGASFKKNNWNNLNQLERVDRSKEIVALCWGNADETEICAGLYNQTVAVYAADAKPKTLNMSKNDTSEGPLIGLSKIGSDFVTCTKSGWLRLWTDAAQEKMEKNVGPDVCCMRRNSQQEHLVATAGKENELKLWDLQKPDEAVFAAKNVRHDWLNLRVPVWVLDINFIPDSKKIVTSTSYHQVRVYDQSVQRRPILDMSFGECPITSLSVLRDGQQVIVGNAHGMIGLLDVRGKGHLVHQFKGSTGGIKAVQSCSSTDVVACCGLDRFLRIYDIQSKLLLHKFYLKSRLNCLLLRQNFSSSSESYIPIVAEEIKVEKKEDEGRLPESDSLWSSMDVVETTKLKRKSKAESAKEFQQAQEEQLDEDINRQQKKKRKKNN